MDLTEAITLALRLRRDGAVLEVSPSTIDRLAQALKLLGIDLESISRPPAAVPIAEWHEDMGPVLLWHFPIEEPPHAGTPMDDDIPQDHYTHFTPLEVPAFPRDALH
jgi:hypothetical protein